LIASVDSLDQGIVGIPASRITEKSGEIKFEMPAFNAEYTGNLNAAKNEITGQWSQSENLEKLDFQRSEKVLELRRPQNPTKHIVPRRRGCHRSSDGKGTLAGTLTVPREQALFPPQSWWVAPVRMIATRLPPSTSRSWSWPIF